MNFAKVFVDIDSKRSWVEQDSKFTLIYVTEIHYQTVF